MRAFTWLVILLSITLAAWQAQATNYEPNTGINSSPGAPSELLLAANSAATTSSGAAEDDPFKVLELDEVETPSDQTESSSQTQPQATPPTSGDDPGLELKLRVDRTIDDLWELLQITYANAYYDPQSQSLVLGGLEILLSEAPNLTSFQAFRCSIRALDMMPDEFWPRRLDLTLHNITVKEEGKLAGLWRDPEMLEILGQRPVINISLEMEVDEGGRTFDIKRLRGWADGLGALDFSASFILGPARSLEGSGADKTKQAENGHWGMFFRNQFERISLIRAQASYSEESLFNRLIEADRRHRSDLEMRGKMIQDVAEELTDNQEGRFLHLAPDLARFILEPVKLTMSLEATGPVTVAQFLFAPDDVIPKLKIQAVAHPPLAWQRKLAEPSESSSTPPSQ